MPIAFALVLIISAVPFIGAGCSERDGSTPVVKAPLATRDSDWQAVATMLGRPGTLSPDSFVYRVAFPRRDLSVMSYGVPVSPGLAFGSYAAFTRYTDGTAMAMGDLAVLETELQQVTDALHANRIDQTAIHKHLLAHDPAVWWTHFQAIGDPVTIARGLRAALDKTATPPPAMPPPPGTIDLDTAGIDAALGTPGKNDNGIYKFTFPRSEVITDMDYVLPPAMGVTTSLNFQPVGTNKAAINGDFVMTANEVQPVIQALRAGGISVVELHNHALTDEPRLFYLHFWAVADGVALATTLRAAVDATQVKKP